MKLTTTFRSGPQPFEGDRDIMLRGIPDNARIIDARVEVLSAAGEPDFVIDQDISFATNGVTFGATKTQGNGSGVRWVEVHFDARRTLASVVGLNLDQTQLQVDLGGAYVEVDRNGAFLSPSGGRFTVSGNNSDLPSLNVARFKLTTPPAAALQPDIQRVTIRSSPTNLSFRIGDLAPFWFVTGELTGSDTSPDFAELLQSFLADAELENGFYNVPLVVHSDTLAKLDFKLEIDFVAERNLLSPGLNEAKLSFGTGGLPTEATVPALEIPADAPVNVRGLSGRIIGGFGETRIAAGTREIVSNTTPVELITTEEQRTLRADRASPAFAQPIEIEQTDQRPANAKISATAIDVLLTIVAPCRLHLDLRRDANGKPSSDSMLPVPIEFDVEPNPDNESVWISVPLENNLILGGRQTSNGKPQQYWLVLQSVAQDSFIWNASASKPGKPDLHRTLDGGHSWRAVSGLSALYRVRHEPEEFTMPIALQIGQGSSSVSVSLDRFAPLGRVDASLDFPAVVDAINLSIKKNFEAPDRVVCSNQEHIVNGDFEFWIPDGGEVVSSSAADPPRPNQPDEWNLISGQVRPFILQPPFNTVAVLVGGKNPAVLSQVVPVQQSCTYQIGFYGVSSAEGTVARIRWLNRECEAVRVDRISVKVLLRDAVAETPVAFADFGMPDAGQLLQFHRLQTTSPQNTEQVEIRFEGTLDVAMAISCVSLKGTNEKLVNADLKQLDVNDRPIGWTIEPQDTGAQFTFNSLTRVLSVNDGGSSLQLSQTIEASGEQQFELQIQAQSRSAAAMDNPFRAEIVWRSADNNPLGNPTSLTLPANGFNLHAAKGTTPQGTANATLRLLSDGGNTLEIQDASLRFSSSQSLPLTIVAQAPGEATLLDLRAEFEPSEAATPEIPDTGLCFPMPSDKEHCQTEKASQGDCCPDCGSSLKGLTVMKTRNDRPARIGRCSSCRDSNSRIVRFGGRFDATAPLLASRKLEPATLVAQPRPISFEIATFAVSDIPLIGGTTSENLLAAGITTIDDLAKFDETKTVEGISTERLTGFIEQAKTLTNPSTNLATIRQNLKSDAFKRLKLDP